MPRKSSRNEEKLRKSGATVFSITAENPVALQRALLAGNPNYFYQCFGLSGFGVKLDAEIGSKLTRFTALRLVKFVGYGADAALFIDTVGCVKTWKKKGKRSARASLGNILSSVTDSISAFVDGSIACATCCCCSPVTSRCVSSVHSIGFALKVEQKSDWLRQPPNLFLSGCYADFFAGSEQVELENGIEVHSCCCSVARPYKSNHTVLAEHIDLGLQAMEDLLHDVGEAGIAGASH